MKNKAHPYGFRRWLRSKLPWFLIDWGIAEKGADCEKVGAEHDWYNMDNELNGCYYCQQTEKRIEKKGD